MYSSVFSVSGRCVLSVPKYATSILFSCWELHFVKIRRAKNQY